MDGQDAQDKNQKARERHERTNNGSESIHHAPHVITPITAFPEPQRYSLFHSLNIQKNGRIEADCHRSHKNTYRVTGRMTKRINEITTGSRR